MGAWRLQCHARHLPFITSFIHRCIRQRMGSPHGPRHSTGEMVYPRQGIKHQLPGNESILSSYPCMADAITSRGHEVSALLEVGYTFICFGRLSELQAGSMSHPRKIFHTGRLTILEEEDRTHGMALPSRDIQVENINLEYSTSRPIRHLPQPQATSLCHPSARPTSPLDGCSIHYLEGIICRRISPFGLA